MSLENVSRGSEVGQRLHLSSGLTCAPELLAFDLADAFVRQPPRVAAAGAAGLDGVVEQVICQPLQVAVAHKGVLGQMAGTERRRRRRRDEGINSGINYSHQMLIIQ